jgi:CheY-like chemotaxis protein
MRSAACVLGGDVAVTKRTEVSAAGELNFLLEDDEAAPHASVTHEVRPQRVLLVDDNIDAVAMLDVLLRLDGHDVRIAHSGVDALECLQDFAADAVLLDIGLPGLDGYEVARRVRQNARFDNTRLIAMTGYGQEQDQERARAAGFAAHLVKPVQFSQIQRELAGTSRS